MSRKLHAENRIDGPWSGIARIDIRIRADHDGFCRRGHPLPNLDADGFQADFRLDFPGNKERVLERPDGMAGTAANEGLIPGFQNVDGRPGGDPPGDGTAAVGEKHQVFLL